ncbi:MAG: DNA primase, partial [Collinsella sp.]
QETVELKPRGHDFWGCCPFHGEKTPSFHIIPATQVWHCFGCGEGGDVFTYIMKRENLSFPESIRYLADRAGIELHDTGDRRERGTKRARIYDLCAETARFYHTMLMRGKDGRPREYFASRGMGGDVCRRYCLGFAPGRNALVSHLSQAGFTPQEMSDANVAVSRGRGQLADRFYDRVMFPIFDEQGHNIAFGGRIMGDGQPKYLNTAETSVFHKKRNLYGFNWAKEFIVAQDTAIVVEGYTDCIACWEAGIKNVVATLGTALTEHHVKTLTRFAKRIVYMFDGDAAGQKAARRAIQFIEQDSMDLRCVVLPAGNDPMEFITAHGGEALQARIDAAEPLMDFVYRSLQESSDITTPGGRAKALEDALTLIYPLRNSYMIDTYFIQIADLLGLDLETVRASSGRVFRDVAKREDAERRREQNYERPRAQAERSGSAGGRTSGSQGRLVALGRRERRRRCPHRSRKNRMTMCARGLGAAPVDSPTICRQSMCRLGWMTRRRCRCNGRVCGTDDADRADRPGTKSLAGARLLTMLTSYPDLFRVCRPHLLDRVVDPRHESIA